jgi:hypothetical protein
MNHAKSIYLPLIFVGLLCITGCRTFTVTPDGGNDPTLKVSGTLGGVPLDFAAGNGATSQRTGVSNIGSGGRVLWSEFSDDIVSEHSAGYGPSEGRHLRFELTSIGGGPQSWGELNDAVTTGAWPLETPLGQYNNLPLTWDATGSDQGQWSLNGFPAIQDVVNMAWFFSNDLIFNFSSDDESVCEQSLSCSLPPRTPCQTHVLGRAFELSIFEGQLWATPPALDPDMVWLWEAEGTTWTSVGGGDVLIDQVSGEIAQVSLSPAPGSDRYGVFFMERIVALEDNQFPCELAQFNLGLQFEIPAQLWVEYQDVEGRIYRTGRSCNMGLAQPEWAHFTVDALENFEISDQGHITKKLDFSCELNMFEVGSMGAGGPNGETKDTLTLRIDQGVMAFPVN